METRILASIANDPGGRRLILFLKKAATCKTILLGKVSKRLAEANKITVESFNTKTIAGTTRDTELAAVYPLHVVCAWIGNNALIAQKHYLHVTNAGFTCAARTDSALEPETAQHRAYGKRTK